MKKLLILSTALTSLAVIQAAQAADITVSGNTEFHLNAPSDTAADDTETTTDDKGIHTAITSYLTVNASFVSDSGLTYSASQTLTTAGGGGNTKADGLSLTVGTDFGSLQFSDGHGYSDDMETNADVAADEATTSSADFNGESAVGAHIAGGTISYLSPTIRGIQASFGYGNGGREDDRTGISYGVSYTGGNMHATWRLAYAGSTISEQTTGAIPAGETDYPTEVTATSAGVSGTFRNLTAAFALNTETTEGGADYTSNNFGATYQVRDNLGVALHLAQATDNEDENYAYNETAMSASYTFAPGLSSAVTYTIWDDAGTAADNTVAENDGTYAKVELKVAF